MILEIGARCESRRPRDPVVTFSGHSRRCWPLVRARPPRGTGGRRGSRASRLQAALRWGVRLLAVPYSAGDLAGRRCCGGGLVIRARPGEGRSGPTSGLLPLWIVSLSAIHRPEPPSPISAIHRRLRRRTNDRQRFFGILFCVDEMTLSGARDVSPFETTSRCCRQVAGPLEELIARAFPSLHRAFWVSRLAGTSPGDARPANPGP